MANKNDATGGSETPVAANTRRDLLRKSAALGAAGVVGIGGFSSSAAALHCDAPADDSDYNDHLSSSQSQADKNIELVSGSDVAYIGSATYDNIDSNRIAHIFYFVTNAVTQYEYSQDPVNAVDRHEVTVDASNVDTSSVDFCQSATGIHPGGDHESSEKFVTLANFALEAMDHLTGYGVPLVDASVFQDNYWDNFDNSQIQNFGLQRNFSPQHETKVQGMFEVTHDLDQAGRVKLVSETEGYRPMASDAATPKTEEHFWLYCSDSFVTIDDEPPGSP